MKVVRLKVSNQGSGSASTIYVPSDMAHDEETEPVRKPLSGAPLLIVVGIILGSLCVLGGYIIGCVTTRDRAIEKATAQITAQANAVATAAAIKQAMPAALAIATAQVEGKLIRSIENHERISLKGHEYVSVWNKVR